jgi:hypothetical protein
LEKKDLCKSLLFEVTVVKSIDSNVRFKKNANRTSELNLRARDSIKKIDFKTKKT